MNGVARLVQLVSRNAQPSATKQYLAPGSPYRRMSAQDEASFRPVLNAWRPTPEPGTTLVRWLTTEWCNYSCPYCPQTHARWEPKGDEFTAHAFDNFPLDSWIEALLSHHKSNRVSWLEGWSGGSWESRPSNTCKMGVFSKPDIHLTQVTPTSCSWAHSVLASQSATIERYGVGSTAMACCTRR